METGVIHILHSLFHRKILCKPDAYRVRGLSTGFFTKIQGKQLVYRILLKQYLRGEDSVGVCVIVPLGVDGQSRPIG